jgi:hypothetical protein
MTSYRMRGLSRGYSPRTHSPSSFRFVAARGVFAVTWSHNGLGPRLAAQPKQGRLRPRLAAQADDLCADETSFTAFKYTYQKYRGLGGAE